MSDERMNTTETPPRCIRHQRPLPSTDVSAFGDEPGSKMVYGVCPECAARREVLRLYQAAIDRVEAESFAYPVKGVARATMRDRLRLRYRALRRR